jgi:diacylglycerol kinase (ATP)
MRVSLVHNASAGDRQHVREELLVGLQRAGHEVHVCVDDIDGADFDRLLTDPGDAVVVGGGDGSIRRVAAHIAGRGVPIAVVPLGTANNIARSLGLPLNPARIIRQLESMVPREYDIGRIAAPWGQNFFLEGAGFGPFVRTALLLSNPSQQEVFDHLPAKLARDRQLLEAMIRDYAAQACEIMLDDESVTGNYLAVHIMNISSVGPNLELAPRADPSDGLLDVVIVGDGDRRGLTDLVTGKGQAEYVERLPKRRSRTVRLRWQGAEIHIDDELYQLGEPGELVASVVPGALTFLVLNPLDEADRCGLGAFHDAARAGDLPDGSG